MKKQTIIFSILAAVIVFLTAGKNFMAQASTTFIIPPTHCLNTSDDVYECLDSNNPNGPIYQFQDISGNHPPLVFGDDDDGINHLTMPFSSTLYDRTSNKMTVSMNGVIKFGTHGGLINAYNASLAVAPTYFIAPFWDDLDNSPGFGGGVYTDTVGNAPNRQFILQWENIPHYNNTGSSTFQVIFYENSNELLFQYEDVVYEHPNFDYGRSATIGIKGDNSYVQYGYNNYQYLALEDDLAIHFFSSTDTPPTAEDDGYSINHGEMLTVSVANGVLNNDTDPQGNGLTAALLDASISGTLDFQGDGSFTFMPEAGFTGLTEFAYYANDGTSNSNGVAVMIYVMNTAPTAVADTYTTTLTNTLTITAPGLLANDNDSDGDELTAILNIAPTHGSLTFNGDGSFIYTPDNGYIGTDQFTYHVTDGIAESNTVTVKIHVTGSYIYLPVIMQ